MSEPTTPPTGASVETDNAVIRQMREQIDAAKAAAKAAEDARVAAETQLKELERRDMDEKQRLAAELADAKKAAEDAQRLRDEHGKFVSEFEKLYKDQLSAVPEDKRALVEQVSSVGDWPARVTSLRAAIGLIGISNLPTAAGTVTQPSGGTPPPTAPPETPKTQQPLTPEELNRTSLGGLIEARRIAPK